MCVGACTCSFTWRVGEGCLQNSEQWECTVVRPEGSELALAALHKHAQLAAQSLVLKCLATMVAENTLSQMQCKSVNYQGFLLLFSELFPCTLANQQLILPNLCKRLMYVH